MRPRRLSRGWNLQAGTLAVATLAAAGGILGGCSGSAGGSLAHQACDLVAQAGRLRAEAEAGTGGNPASLIAEANGQLELAEPEAAQAAGADPTWQGLSANLLEVGKLPTALIMPALRADCSNLGVHVP